MKYNRVSVWTTRFAGRRRRRRRRPTSPAAAPRLCFDLKELVFINSWSRLVPLVFCFGSNLGRIALEMALFHCLYCSQHAPNLFRVHCHSCRRSKDQGCDCKLQSCGAIGCGWWWWWWLGSVIRRHGNVVSFALLLVDGEIDRVPCDELCSSKVSFKKSSFECKLLIVCYLLCAVSANCEPCGRPNV